MALHLYNAPVLAPYATEVDLITPRVGEVYNYTGLSFPVVIIAQNLKNMAAKDQLWGLLWTLRSWEVTPEGQWTFQHSNGMGPNAFVDDPVVIQDLNDGPYIELSQTPAEQPMAPGVYLFEWSLLYTRRCDFTNSTVKVGDDEEVGAGSFNFTVAASASYPALTTCGSLGGMFGFAQTTTFTSGSVFTQTSTCVVTESVTETPNPCRATMEPTNAQRISVAMNWTTPTPTGRTGNAGIRLGSWTSIWSLWLILGCTGWANW